ncbi:MAG TPA: M48 family metallopeptidase [Solirubrobacterales bacterium]|nr:M48 family metallopeptidase [Solirubrobacterales bacterium]
MSDKANTAYRLAGISPEAYRHPLDRAATAALQRIPHFDSVMRRLLGLGVDRIARASLMAGAVRLGENQLPHVWRLHEAVFEALDVDDVPELYLQQDPTVNAMAGGTLRPKIVVNSRLIDVLDETSLKAILGHEAAHVHCNHVLYGTVLGYLGRFAAATMPAALAGLPVLAISHALLGWSRAAEFSSDRGAALATRDPDSVCQALMTITAGTAAQHLNLDAFVDQGLEYEADGSSTIRRLADIQSTHPLTIRRVQALLDWVGSGEYERLIAGDYIKRGEEGVFRDEVDQAAQRYAEQLDRLALDSDESLDEMDDEMGAWLERTDAQDLGDDPSNALD